MRVIENMCDTYDYECCWQSSLLFMLVEFKEVVEEGGKGLNAVLQERTQFKRANVSYISGEEIKDRPDELRAETSIFEGLCLKVAVNDLAELQVTTCYMSTIPIYHL